MFVHNIDPTLFRIGILEIRYYGIIYALGFIIAYFMIDYLVKRKEVDLTKEDVADLVFYLIIGTIAGARLFFVFYNLGYFIKNPLEIITIWRGGLIFLGGFIGAIIAVKLFCKKKNISFYKIAVAFFSKFVIILYYFVIRSKFYCIFLFRCFIFINF